MYVLNEFSIYIYGVLETVGPHFDIRVAKFTSFGWAIFGSCSTVGNLL